MPFETRPTDVALRGAGPGLWRLTADVIYRGATDTFVVPRGFHTDFATIPQLLMWLIPRDGAHTLAAVLHDWAVTEGIRTGRITPRDADGLLRRALRELGVRPVRRWLMWVGVRVGAIANPLRRPGTLRDVPAILAAACVVVPVAAPAVLFALLALGVYSAAELGVAAASWFCRWLTLESRS